MASCQRGTGTPRQVSRRQYLTFDSGFERGLDPHRWRECGYPWITDDPQPGRQPVIHDEQQYYLQREDPRYGGDFAPWLINEAGHLILRCMPTPPCVRHLACGELDRYVIVALDATRRRVSIRGRPWQDPMTGERYRGINRYRRDRLEWTGVGFLCIGDSPKRQMYRRIEDAGGSGAVDPHESTGIETLHTIELFDEIEDADQIIPGRTTLTLLRHMPYVSGMLTTRGAFAQTYGSWHVRLRCPHGRGTLAGVSLWPPGQSGGGAAADPLADRCVGISLLEKPGHADTLYHGLYQPARHERAVREAALPESYRVPAQGPVEVTHHAVALPASDPASAADKGAWIEVIFDWYPDNTCAWFVRQGDQFLETARAEVPGGDGARSPRMIVLTNAFDGRFNREWERRDQMRAAPCRLQSAPPWDVEIAFVRAWQWEGYPPFMGELPVLPETLGELARQRYPEPGVPLRLAA